MVLKHSKIPRLSYFIAMYILRDCNCQAKKNGIPPISGFYLFIMEFLIPATTANVE